MPWLIRRRDDEWCVYKEANGEPEGEALGCHATQADAEEQRRALEANVEEAASASKFVREFNVGRFRGDFPDVPVADGVNMAELREMDDDPMFVTLPIVPEIGAVSRNGLLYDEALADSIVEQINRKRPGGRFGHLKDEDADSAFPIPAGMWVGARRVGNAVWGKAYIPPGAARDHVRRLKAIGGSIATSIFGKGQHESVRQGVDRLASFELETVDFAPPERAALGNGTTPVVTAEMNSESSQEPEENDMPTKEEIIAELTVDELPSQVREQIIADWQRENQTTERIAELEQQVEDKDSVIETLQGQIDERKGKDFERAVDSKVAELTDWQVNGDKSKERLDAFRRTVRSRIVAELADERDEDRVSEVADDVWADLKPVAETVRDALAGPNAFVGGKQRDSREIEDTEENRAKARRQFTF